MVMVTDGQTEGRCRLGREQRVSAQGVVGVMGIGRLGSASLEGKGSEMLLDVGCWGLELQSQGQGSIR